MLLATISMPPLQRKYKKKKSERDGKPSRFSFDIFCAPPFTNVKILYFCAAFNNPPGSNGFSYHWVGSHFQISTFNGTT